MFKRTSSEGTSSIPDVFAGPVSKGLHAAPGALKGFKVKVLIFLLTIILGVFTLSQVDKATMAAQKVQVCQDNQWSVKVPRVHIALPSWMILDAGGSDEPALRDILARDHPELSLNDVIAANPDKDLSPMGLVSKTYGGVECINLPTTKTNIAPTAAVTPSKKASPSAKATAPQSAAELSTNPASSVKTAPPVVSLTVKHKATDLQLAAAVVAAGFQKQQAITAVSVAIAESGGNPHVVCYNTGSGCSSRPTGLSYDRGFFQFNSRSHPEVSTSCSKDLLCSAREAYRVSSRGNNWRQWATYLHGSNQKYIKRATKAVSTMMGV